jgi:hypothetical protein
MAMATTTLLSLGIDQSFLAEEAETLKRKMIVVLLVVGVMWR